MGLTLPPFEAYTGDEKYIFASYSQSDRAEVFPELLRLHEAGYRIWYDEGIDPGNDWPEEIARALHAADFFLVFISPASVESTSVRNEISYALNSNKPLLAVHLADVLLPRGLELRMGDIQAVLKWRMDDAAYQSRMEKALPADACANPQAATASAAVRPASEHLVFISAKSEDYEYAAQVYQFLTGEGLRVFFSAESLPELGSADYADQIDDAIEEATHMVVVASSRDRVTSPWVEREWRLFDNEKRSGRKAGNLLTVTTGGMRIGDLPVTLRCCEVVGLSNEGLYRLLGFVKNPPPKSLVDRHSAEEIAQALPTPPVTTPVASHVVVSSPEPAVSAAGTHGLPVPSEDDDFVFVSYKREDLSRIAPFLARFCEWGFEVWYDRGIPGGAEWDALIEEKLSRCKALVVFLTQAAVESKWVRREVKFADTEDRPILGIRVDKDVELKHGLKLVMSQYQMIDATDADFSDTLRKAIEYVRLM